MIRLFHNSVDQMTPTRHPEPDFAILLPAEDGRPNALSVHKHVLAEHSLYFKKLFQRHPEVDAYRVSRLVRSEDIQAVLNWMYDPSCDLNRWPWRTLGNCFSISKQLKMNRLSDAICRAVSVRDPQIIR